MLYFDNDIFSQFSTPSAGLLFVYMVAKSDNNGVLTTSLSELVDATGLKINTIRQNLSELEALQAIHKQATNRGRQITINNIDSYKNFRKRVTNKLQAERKQEESFNDNYCFDNVWELYQKKKGSNPTIKRRWELLSIEDKQMAFDFIPKYVALTEMVYRKNFQTFLNQRAWEDEIIETQGICVPVADFKAKLVEDPTLFPQFVERFNMMVAGTKIPQVNMKDGLTEKRRVLFNIAYCLHFHDMKQVMEFVVRTPRYNGMAGTGFVANYDYIFKPENFIKLLEESQN